MKLHFYNNENFLEIGLYNYNIDFILICKFLNEYADSKFKFKIIFYETVDYPKYNEKHNNIKALKSVLMKEYGAVEDKNWRWNDGQVQIHR